MNKKKYMNKIFWYEHIFMNKVTFGIKFCIKFGQYIKEKAKK